MERNEKNKDEENEKRNEKIKERINVVSVVAIGLPAVGKTKFFSLMEKLLVSNSTFFADFLHFSEVKMKIFSFDDLISFPYHLNDNLNNDLNDKNNNLINEKLNNKNNIKNNEIKEENEEKEWKKQRDKIKEKIKEKIIKYKKNKTTLTIIIIDDNNYYRSMRYSYYQLCLNEKISFIQLTFLPPLSSPLSSSLFNNINNDINNANNININNINNMNGINNNINYNNDNFDRGNNNLINNDIIENLQIEEIIKEIINNNNNNENDLNIKFNQITKKLFLFKNKLNKYNKNNVKEINEKTNINLIIEYDEKRDQKNMVGRFIIEKMNLLIEYPPIFLSPPLFFLSLSSLFSSFYNKNYVNNKVDNEDNNLNNDNKVDNEDKKINSENKYQNLINDLENYFEIIENELNFLLEINNEKINNKINNKNENKNKNLNNNKKERRGRGAKEWEEKSFFIPSFISIEKFLLSLTNQKFNFLYLKIIILFIFKFFIQIKKNIYKIDIKMFKRIEKENEEKKKNREENLKNFKHNFDLTLRKINSISSSSFLSSLKQSNNIINNNPSDIINNNLNNINNDNKNNLNNNDNQLNKNEVKKKMEKLSKEMSSLKQKYLSLFATQLNNYYDKNNEEEEDKDEDQQIMEIMKTLEIEYNNHSSLLLSSLK